MSDLSPFFLSSDFPATRNEGKERLERLLEEGCPCGCESATLTRRKQSNGVWVAALQCDDCGSAKMSGLRRVDFIDFDNFPEFDFEAQNRYYEESKNKIFETREKLELDRIALQEEYAAFLKSREWYNLRNIKLQRDGLKCEACGQNNHVNNLLVHHLTYRFGFMPPLWLLKTVCRKCHDRLHADKHGFEDPWCPSSLVQEEL